MLIKVRFDEPQNGWILLSVWNDGVLLRCPASYIYDSFGQLVTALSAIYDGREELFVVWNEEATEWEMRFSRRDDDDVIRLEITMFEGRERPREKPEPDFCFVGTYDEICLPFWRALRSLQGRYSPEELAQRWKGYFPHRELALLTQQLGKG